MTIINTRDSSLTQAIEPLPTAIKTVEEKTAALAVMALSTEPTTAAKVLLSEVDETALAIVQEFGSRGSEQIIMDPSTRAAVKTSLDGFS